VNKFFKFIKTDFFIIFFLLIISGIPRLVLLDKIPPGIHGDEGLTGIIAREILSKGSVPSYVAAAAGIPSGSIYPTALIFKIFGENIFLLRVSPAIAGILTIIAFYVFLRLFFNKKVSILTTIAFNFSLIHIHYSRIAYNVIYLPLLQLMSLIFFILYRRKNNSLFIILSAIFAGFGFHSYHVFILFPLSLISLLVVDIYRYKFSFLKIKQLFLFIVFFGIVSFPILKVMVFQPDFYFSHVKTYNILNENNVKNKVDFINKSKLILKNGFENLSFFILGGKVDFIDAFGKYYNFNRSYLILFFLGICLSFIENKRINYFILFSLVFFLAPTFFTFEGTYRRSILTLIYFYYFFAVAIKWIVGKVKNKQQIIIIFLLTTIIVTESFINLITYFNFFPYDQESKFVYTYELTNAGIRINQMTDEKTEILFLSSRWSCKYETLRFINHDRTCEDRSKEFGNFDLSPKSQNNVLFVLLNEYVFFIKEIKNKYPGGKEKIILDNKTKNIIGVLYKI
jgi:4-amino-4-deoxy-L-arabinose transferase-like glycosyltransferase